MNLKVSPSILAADFANLQKEVQKVESKAAMLHVDIMDGHFVPNISIGVPVVESLRKHTNMFLDTHLMISRPQDYIEPFARAGSDLLCFHAEADCEINQTIRLIRSFHKKAALALKPGTPAEAVFPYLKELDMVLVMTVEPGFGGQSFMEAMMLKVAQIRRWAKQIHPQLDIEVDGGINQDTAKLAVRAGANVLVAGSSVFGSNDPAKEIEVLNQIE